jgi:hypothetical protein
MAVPLKEQIKIITELAFSDRKILKALLSLKHSGYLVDIGWFNAFKSKMSIGYNNEPVPWVTYPFIDFISPRLNKSLLVFEFGSGNSTLFYSKKVNKVVTVEHNRDWFDKVKSELPANAEIIYKSLDGTGYEKAAQNYNYLFDIIIIDAEKRVECLKNSIHKLNETGVIILDDSDRSEYLEAYSVMKETGYKYIDFWGISPGFFNRKSTTVFYKSNNCLDI